MTVNSDEERSREEVRYNRIAFPLALLEAGERVMAKIYEKRDSEAKKQSDEKD